MTTPPLVAAALSTGAAAASPPAAGLVHGAGLTLALAFALTAALSFTLARTICPGALAVFAATGFAVLTPIGLAVFRAIHLAGTLFGAGLGSSLGPLLLLFLRLHLNGITRGGGDLETSQRCDARQRGGDSVCFDRLHLVASFVNTLGKTNL